MKNCNFNYIKNKLKISMFQKLLKFQVRGKVREGEREREKDREIVCRRIYAQETFMANLISLAFI